MHVVNKCKAGLILIHHSYNKATTRHKKIVWPTGALRCKIMRNILKQNALEFNIFVNAKFEWKNIYET